MRPRPPIPAEIEDYRDEHWHREGVRQIETVLDAERFIDRVGFTACLVDSRRPGPSLYVAVCGRRDAVMPRNVQKDPEASLTWRLKDELVRRGKVYYAKLARGKATFLAARMIPYFWALWGVRRSEEKLRLSRNAQAVVRVLRHEWELGTADLRSESGVNDRKAFTQAVDELQAAMIVVPSQVVYQPRFTYLWTLGVGRFPTLQTGRVSRGTALRGRGVECRDPGHWMRGYAGLSHQQLSGRHRNPEATFARPPACRYRLRTSREVLYGRGGVDDGAGARGRTPAAE